MPKHGCALRSGDLLSGEARAAFRSRWPLHDATPQTLDGRATLRKHLDVQQIPMQHLQKQGNAHVAKSGRMCTPPPLVAMGGWHPQTRVWKVFRRATRTIGSSIAHEFVKCSTLLPQSIVKRTRLRPLRGCGDRARATRYAFWSAACILAVALHEPASPRV